MHPLTQWEMAMFHAALSRHLSHEFPESEDKPHQSADD